MRRVGVVVSSSRIDHRSAIVPLARRVESRRRLAASAVVAPIASLAEEV
jgi:hypothetical protein